MRVLRSFCIHLLLAIIMVALLPNLSLSQPPNTVRELVELRTANAKQWLNEDGTRTAEIFAGPVHYQDSSGAWQDIDTTIGPAEKEWFGHSAIHSWFRTHLSRLANGWHLLESGSTNIAFMAADATPSEGLVDGSNISYPDAWRSADLRYTVEPNGIKESIILKNVTSARRFRFTMNPGDLRPIASGNGIDFCDASGTVRAKMMAPFMCDANGSCSDSVQVTWQSLPGGSIVLVLHPDEAWMSNAAYPVTIDPTFFIYGSGSTVDQYYDYNPNTNSGEWYDTQPLMMGTQGGRFQHACVKFNTSSITGAIIDSATLSVYANAVAPYCTAKIRKITQSWPSNPFPTPPLSNYNISQIWGGPGLKTFDSSSYPDLQSWVSSWAADPATNYGVDITSSQPYSLPTSIYGSEASNNVPTLIVHCHFDPPVFDYVYDGDSGSDIDYTNDAARPCGQWQEHPAADVIYYGYMWSTSKDTPPTSWQTTTATQAHYSPASRDDCEWYWWVKAYTNSYGWSTPVHSNGVCVDTRAPDGSLVINPRSDTDTEGAPFTDIEKVSLKCQATDVTSGMADMMISNSASFTGASWEPYQLYKDWTIEPDSETHTATVWIKYRDRAGNETVQCASDSITMDNSELGYYSSLVRYSN